MRSIAASVAALGIICVALHAQGKPGQRIQHHNGTATVAVNDPRPLAQAVIAAREEYGWQVDYEDPPWKDGSDLRDISPAAWRAAHPGRQGFMVPAGGSFQSTYPESADMWAAATEELQVLDKIVSDYNASGNPGRFEVRAQPDGSFAVVGISSEGQSGGQVAAPPYLDAIVSVPTATRSVQTTLELILSAVSAKTGIVGRLGGGSINLFMSASVSIGGSNLPARDLLTSVGESMGLKMLWDLYYLPSLGKYALVYRQTALAVPGPFGRTHLLPAGPVPGSGGLPP